MIELGLAADLATTVDYTLFAEFADVLGEGGSVVLENRNGGDTGGNPCAGYAIDPFCNIGDT